MPKLTVAFRSFAHVVHRASGFSPYTEVFKLKSHKICGCQVGPLCTYGCMKMLEDEVF